MHAAAKDPDSDSTVIDSSLLKDGVTQMYFAGLGLG